MTSVGFSGLDLKLTVGRFGRADTHGAGVLSSSESLSDSDEGDSCGSSWLLMSEIVSLLLRGESLSSDSDGAYSGAGVCVDDDASWCVLP